MNISQITSFNQAADKNIIPKKGEIIHAKVFSSSADELNMNKEHEKMIVIGGRIYKLETSLHIDPNKHYKVQVLETKPNQIAIKLISTNTPPPLTHTLLPTQLSPKDISLTPEMVARLIPLMIHNTTITPKKIYNIASNTGIDSISRLLTGLSSTEINFMESQKENKDISLMMDGWILKSERLSEKDNNVLFFQLVFVNDDGEMDESDIEYSESMEDGKKTIKFTLKRDSITTAIISKTESILSVKLFTLESVDEDKLTRRIKLSLEDKPLSIDIQYIHRELMPQAKENDLGVSLDETA